MPLIKSIYYTDYGTETEVSAPLNRKFNIFTKFPKRGFETNFHKRNKYVLPFAQNYFIKYFQPNPYVFRGFVESIEWPTPSKLCAIGAFLPIKLYNNR